MTFSCVGFTRTIVNDDVSHLTSSEPYKKTEKKYYRYKKRIYLEDVESIEEYYHNEFKNFSKSPLCTIIMYSGEVFVAEMDFYLMEKILNRFDQNRTLIINN